MTIKVNSWAFVLAVLFVGLKLTGFIDWSWWWVLAPIWIPLAIIIIALSIVLLQFYGVK